MISCRKTLVLGLAVASLGMGVGATSTPVAAWDFQHRDLSSGFDHGFQYWGPGVGGVAPATTYPAFEKTCYFTDFIAANEYGYYHEIVRVCQ